MNSAVVFTVAVLLVFQFTVVVEGQDKCDKKCPEGQCCVSFMGQEGCGPCNEARDPQETSSPSTPSTTTPSTPSTTTPSTPSTTTPSTPSTTTPSTPSTTTPSTPSTPSTTTPRPPITRPTRPTLPF